jgi:formamidopyrimidine-DNA glycosylase
MPELPEVETIRRRLAPLLVGRRISGVVVHRDDIVGFPDAAGFVRQVSGHRIAGTNRRGKYLILELDGDRQLIIHLRLSGHLEVVTGGARPQYERVRFGLSDGKALSFAEPRALGRVYFVDRAGYPSALAGMREMGEEPVGAGFTADYLAVKLRGRQASVKSLLVDQRVCCGVGNIYSDEALHRAGIRPTRRAGRLSRAEVGRLVRALRGVLNDGIKWCGTTMKDERYVLPDGTRGGFQGRLHVFGREGQRCRRPGCQGVIRRAEIGNRGARYCPVCQE